MLHSGQEENLKNVNMTFFPFIAPMSNVLPSMAGRTICGALSPVLIMLIIQTHGPGILSLPNRKRRSRA